MAKKFGVSLERTNVRKLITDEASKNKEAFRKNLEGKYIYLKMDAATRHRVNYFAINVRFVGDDGKIVTKTLAVRDTRAHHDSSYLHRLIEDILAEFEIKKGQILCIVSDNASNIVRNFLKKMIHLTISLKRRHFCAKFRICDAQCTRCNLQSEME